MPRTGLRVVVEVNVHAVTAPGVWLPYRDDVYLSVCLLGHHRRTNLADPVFPVLFHEKIRFERPYYSVFDPSDVSRLLEEEHVLIELIQVSPTEPNGVLLASFEDNARDFLFPAVSLAPVYGSQDRELLMERTVDFPGISPKVEFSTMTVIEEAKTTLDPDESYGRHSVSPRLSRSLSRKKARSPTPVVNAEESDEPRPGYEQHTIASFSRSRSPSPIRRRMEDLSLSTTVADKPFVVRKLDSSLIGRTPGSPAPSTASKTGTKKKKKGSSLSGSVRSRSVSPSRLTSRPLSPSRLVTEYCPHCLNPHTEQSCTVCRLYRKYTGQKYWGHTYHYHPPGSKHRHKTVKVVRDPEYLSSTALDTSYDLYDPLSPRYRYYRSLSPRYSPSYLYSSARTREISRRVDDAIRRSQSPVLYNETLDQLADDLERSRDWRLGYVDDNCSVHRSPYSSIPRESHRSQLDRNIDRLYSNMYRKTRTYNF